MSKILINEETNMNTIKTIINNLLKHNQICKPKDKIGSKAKKRLFYRTILFLPTIIKLQKLYKKYSLDLALKMDINHYNKAYYPLLRKDLNNKDKLKYLEEHFKVISNFKKEYQYALYDDAILLLDMSKYNIEMNLKLQYDHTSRHEGEITIFFDDKNSLNKIFKITGLLSKNIFYIGGVQGQTSNDQMRSLTKECFGMRPHNFLLYCLMEFSQNLGCSSIYAIKNNFHVSNARARTRGKILFDYDAFFKELNIISETPSWHILDAKYQLKNISEIKSKKRSMYKKRYDLLENISADINNRTRQLL